MADSNSGSDAPRRHRPSPSSRRNKAKAVAVERLLQLPLLETPAPLTRGKLKQIALRCDLNVAAILDQAQERATRVSYDGAAASTSDGGSSASSVRANSLSNE